MRGLSYHEFEYLSRPLDDSQRLALALTEACCKIGRGKIFYLPGRRTPNDPPMGPGPSEGDEAKIYYRLPQLLYLPFIWDPAASKRWLDIDHEEQTDIAASGRLCLLNARSGGLNLNAVVMPIDVSWSQPSQDAVYVNAYTEPQFVMMFVTPRIFLGQGFQIRDVCPPYAEHWGDVGGNARWAVTFKVTEEDLEDYRVQDVETLARRLFDLFFQADKKPVVLFKHCYEAIKLLTRTDTLK
ncbi:MAG: hypothetical protein OHK93_001261 [Ramalina farinacea]|uniref:Uncharacterized protein n=1 Tax=Ramalina farinacea TaxID=258253 RepID=A0AA43QP68_9LECA|nr:hypothetical protein [Ramalina farinacea]